jgi:hypothetical protein
MRTIAGILLLSGCGLLAAGIVCAQAPPGPLQPAPSSVSNPPQMPPIKKIPPRKTIMGDWKLNREDSDDPRSKMRQAGAKNDPHRNSGGVSGPQVGWPGGGGMGGPYGGRRNPNGNNYPERNPNEAYEKVQSLIDPSIRLHLVQRDPKDPLVELTGDQGKKMVFYTDGKLPDKPSDPNMQMIVARWDGNKLVTDEKLEKNGTLTRSYELSEDGLQLFEEVHLVTGKKKESPVTIRYVYDASESEVEY